MQISSIQNYNTKPAKLPSFKRKYEVIEENGEEFVKIPKKKYDLDNVLSWVLFAMLGFEILGTLFGSRR
jgi:hypothetical protein